MFKNGYSRLIIYSSIVLLIFIRLSIPNWYPTWGTGSVLSWDVMGYYLYLPATFIYHDLSHVGFISDIVNKYQPTIGYYQSFTGPLGTQVMKYSMGWSILNSPFFFFADEYAKWFGYPRDGFSEPYQLMILIGGLFYAFIGLFFLRRCLLFFFSDKIVSLTILLIVFGTNFLEYATFGNALTHISCFALYACLIYVTIQWHEKPSKLYASLIGICAGLLTIVRPSEMICVLIPVLWNCWNKNSWKQKVSFIRNNPGHLVATCFWGIVMVLPQLIYWKQATGQWFYFSYPNEHFNFLGPHLLDFLFSFRKGWLIYSPLMILSLIGLGILYRKKKKIAFSIIVFSLVNIWVLSSWSTWWYGGSFGQRSMVESYAVWSLPLAASVEWISRSSKRWLRYAASILISFFIILNLFQHWQLNHGILLFDGMNADYYFRTFGATKFDEANLQLLPPDQDYPDRPAPNDSAAFFSRTISEDFKMTDTSTKNLQPGQIGSAEYFPGYQFSKKDLSQNLEFWIRFDISIYPFSLDSNLKLVTTVQRGNQTYKYKEIPLKDLNMHSNEWNQFSITNQITNRVGSSDVIKCYVWNRDQVKIAVANARMEVIEPKK